MSKQNMNIELFLQLARTQAVLNRRFDNALGGLGFNEFIILWHLDQAPDKKMSRIDLSDKLGFTASGITRLLLPMEKIGLVKKETHASDARISLVLLAPGGKRKLSEALDRAELLIETVLGSVKPSKTAALSEFLSDLNKTLK